LGAWRLKRMGGAFAKKQLGTPFRAPVSVQDRRSARPDEGPKGGLNAELSNANEQAALAWQQLCRRRSTLADASPVGCKQATVRGAGEKRSGGAVILS
jgi:hypothetical protein